MSSKPGTLYLVPTPIGNLDDLSKRIIDTLNFVDLVFCEDTRVTQKLLLILNIKKKTISCHEHNEKEISKIATKELLEGKNIAYMSDAGYPCISDPGLILVKECINNNIKITPLPGPSASLPALIGSGLDTTHFLFYGFLSSIEAQRIKELESIKSVPYTLIFYESPYRIEKTIKNMKDILKDRKIVLAREISKLHEEFIYETLDKIDLNKITLKGEFVLILEGNTANKDKNKDIDLFDIIYKLKELNLSNKIILDILKITLNINKNEVKDILFKD